MTREEYEKINTLVTKIEVLSNHADLAKEILDNFEKEGGNAKIYASTAHKTYETELQTDMARIVYRDILSNYNHLIVQEKEELDKIIDNCRR